MTIRTSVDLPNVHPYLFTDVAQALAARAGRFAHRRFLVWEPPDGDRKEWTYQTFAEEVDRTAAGLIAQGVQEGDAVLLLLDNSPAFLLIWFACARIGAVAVDANTRYSPDELHYVVEVTQPVGAVTQNGHMSVANELADQLGWTISTGDGSSTSTLWADPSLLCTRSADPAAPLCVQFTSGTTSRPKAALFTHANGLWGAEVGARHAGYTADDVALVCAPLFHTAALSWFALATFWVGGAVVVMPKFSARRFWDVSRRNGCTSTLALGVMLTTLGEEPVPDHRYRFWAFGAEMSAIKERFNVGVFSAWGMTEVVTNVIINDPGFPSEDGVIGRPAPEYEIGIVAEEGADAVTGEVGELRVGGVRGVSLFAEYLGDSEATAASFDDAGRFRTGDLVRVTASGAIRFVGRSKDMLKVGGENVAASEIERVLGGVPGVTAAAVVSRSDPMLGEVPVGFVTIAVGIDAIEISLAALERCRELLADFKVPREVHVIPEMPTVTLGKVDKGRLRVMAAQMGQSSIRTEQ